MDRGPGREGRSASVRPRSARPLVSAVECQDEIGDARVRAGPGQRSGPIGDRAAAAIVYAIRRAPRLAYWLLVSRTLTAVAPQGTRSLSRAWLLWRAGFRCRLAAVARVRS